MAILCCCLPSALFSAQIQPRSGFSNPYPYRPVTNTRSELLRHRLANQETKWTFARGSEISIKTEYGNFMRKKAEPNPTVRASSGIATTLFNLGTAIVLPLYTLMIIAPKQKMTKMTMESHVPYVALGLIYAYVLAISWTPQHIGALFGGNNMMPDFARVGVLFFSELSATAAWIHLLLMDMFCARSVVSFSAQRMYVLFRSCRYISILKTCRQVFLDGLENEVETRHSITLCLFFCPLGILSHAITKILTRMS